MWGWDAQYEMAVRRQLLDLAFIDERDGELEQHLERMRRSGAWGPLGVHGELVGRLGPGAHTDALACVYADVAARLGYFVPLRRPDATEWRELLDEAVVWAQAAPRSAADVEARFGPPSYRRAARDPSVFAYASRSDDPWLSFHFDLASQRLLWLLVPHEFFADAVVDLRPGGASRGAEAAYRSFLIATLHGREREVRRHIVRRKTPAVLWDGAYPAGVAKLLARQYREMTVVHVPPPEDVVFLTSDGCPVPLAVMRDGDEWRVDPAPLVALRIAAKNAAKRRRR